MQNDEEAAGTSKDPAASMSLLQTVLDGALDSGYRRESERPSTKKVSPWRRGIVFVVAIALTFISTIAVKNLRADQSDAAKVQTEIVNRVESRQQHIADLLVSVQDLDAQLSESQSALGAVTADLDPAVVIASGFGQVAGPGVRVTLQDNEALQTQGRGIIRDVDVRQFVNSLWQAGAEAIEVNGIRLGSTTTIRAAGSVILVDLEPVISPYVISAIGNSADLNTAMTAGTNGGMLKELSAQVGFSLTVARDSNLEISAAEPQFTPLVSILTDELGKDQN